MKTLIRSSKSFGFGEIVTATPHHLPMKEQIRELVEKRRHFQRLRRVGGGRYFSWFKQLYLRLCAI